MHILVGLFANLDILEIPLASYIVDSNIGIPNVFRNLIYWASLSAMPQLPIIPTEKIVSSPSSLLDCL
jgi:hypothetical protein